MPKGSKYDGEPMRRFLVLITGEPNVSDWEAGRQVGREQGLKDPEEIERYAEGIRRRYRELRKRGRLPEHSQVAIRSRRMLDAARRWYGDQEAERPKKAERLAALEREARERGLDIGPEVDLMALERSLQQRIESLQIITESGTDVGLGILLQRRPPSAEALHQEYEKAVEELAEARARHKLVEGIRECRYYLRVTDFPRNGESDDA